MDEVAGRTLDSSASPMQRQQEKLKRP